MELSNRDIEKLVEMSYWIEDFAIVDNCVIRLRNIDGYCYFYNQTDNKCQIYDNRPIGCFLYPIVYLANWGPIIDELCPMGYTISEQELRTKGKILDKLLKKIDTEVQINQRLYTHL